MLVRMRRGVSGRFHSTYEDVKPGDIVDIPEEDVRRYLHHDVALVELIDDPHY